MSIDPLDEVFIVKFLRNAALNDRYEDLCVIRYGSKSDGSWDYAVNKTWLH